MTGWRDEVHLLISKARTLRLRRRTWRREMLSQELHAVLDAGSERDPVALILLAPDTGNMGDIAILRAQMGLLKEALPSHQVVAVPLRSTYNFVRRFAGLVRSDDVITFNGGGNVGDMYDEAEVLRHFCLGRFRDTPILSFPQSAYYSPTVYGRILLAIMSRAYARHGHVTLFWRDRTSSETMSRSITGASHRLVPDSVLTLSQRADGTPRSGVLVALRDDPERALTEGQASLLRSRLAEQHDCRVMDTHVGLSHVSIEEGWGLLDGVIEAFRSAEVVVTDRLHGMVLALVTGTPCVVFDNSTGKVHRLARTWGLDAFGAHLIEPDEASRIDAAVASVMRDGPYSDPTEHLRGEALTALKVWLTDSRDGRTSRFG